MKNTFIELCFYFAQDTFFTIADNNFNFLNHKNVYQILSDFECIKNALSEDELEELGYNLIDFCFYNTPTSEDENILFMKFLRHIAADITSGLNYDGNYLAEVLKNEQ